MMRAVPASVFGLGGFALIAGGFAYQLLFVGVVFRGTWTRRCIARNPAGPNGHVIARILAGTRCQNTAGKYYQGYEARHGREDCTGFWLNWASVYRPAGIFYPARNLAQN